MVAAWVEPIRAQLEPFLDFDGDNAARDGQQPGLDRAVSAIDFLRDVGKHFPVNRMLATEAVSARLDGGGLSFTEFSYQLLQSNDYLELTAATAARCRSAAATSGATSPPASTSSAGSTGRTVHALTTPLVTKADGTKFGKTEAGTVWLDPDMTSPYAFYQFWLNVDDRDVVTVPEVFTVRSRDEIEDAREGNGRAPSRRAAASVPSRRTSPRWCTGRRSAPASWRPAGRCSARARLEVTRAGHAGGRPDRGAARAVAGRSDSAVVDLLAATGLCPSRSAARRVDRRGRLPTSTTCGSQDPEAVPARDDSCTAAGSCCAGGSGPSPASMRAATWQRPRQRPGSDTGGDTELRSRGSALTRRQ